MSQCSFSGSGGFGLGLLLLAAGFLGGWLRGCRPAGGVVESGWLPGDDFCSQRDSPAESAARLRSTSRLQRQRQPKSSSLTGRRGARRMAHRVQQVAAGLRILQPPSRRRRTLRDQPAAAYACARADVDHMVGRADRVLIMLDHHQRVALSPSLCSASTGSGCRACRPMVGSSST